MKNKLIIAITTILISLGIVNSLAKTAIIDRAYKPIEMKIIKKEGKLLFSDSPEYINEFGIVAKAKIKGGGRIYYYHVNDTYIPAEILVFAQSEKEQKIKIKRIVKGNPSLDYVTTGKTLSENLTKHIKKENIEIIIPSKEKTILNETKENVKPNYLVSGMIDVYSEKETTYGVAILPKIGNIEENLKKAKEIKVDSHEMRGTFISDIYMENEKIWNIQDGAIEIKIGDGKRDIFQKGIDEIDNIERENTGNFGIQYHIKLHSKGEGMYDLYLNPQGGVYMGTIEIGQGYVYYPYKTYRGNKWVGHNTINDYVYMGTWEVGKDLKIKLTPPGASNLPIRLLCIPK